MDKPEINEAENGDFRTNKFFASPVQDGSDDAFALLMTEAIRGIDSLKPLSRNSSAFLGENPELTVTRDHAQRAVLKPEGESLPKFYIRSSPHSKVYPIGDIR